MLSIPRLFWLGVVFMAVGVYMRAMSIDKYSACHTAPSGTYSGCMTTAYVFQGSYWVISIGIFFLALCLLEILVEHERRKRDHG